MKILECEKTGCMWKCCGTFDDNYILLYPSEYEDAIKAGYNFKAFDVISDDKYGGKMIRPKDRWFCQACHNEDKKSYKSLDCVVYPFSLKITGDKLVWIVGEKCPLTKKIYKEDLKKHFESQRNIWLELIKSKPEIVEWLKHIKMVGYKFYKEDSLSTESLLSTGK